MQGENQGVVAACVVVEHDISEGSRGAVVNLMIWVAKLVTEVLRREVGIVDRWSSEERMMGGEGGERREVGGRKKGRWKEGGWEGEVKRGK